MTAIREIQETSWGIPVAAPELTDAAETEQPINWEVACDPDDPRSVAGAKALAELQALS